MIKHILLCSLVAVLLSCATKRTPEPQPLSQAAQNFRLSACNTSSVILNEGFERKKLPANLGQLPGALADASFSTDRSRAGSASLKFSLSNINKHKAPTLAHRTAVALYQDATDSDELWYGFSVYTPAAYMKDDLGPVLLMDWVASYSGEADGYYYQNSPMALVLGLNNTVELVYRSASEVPKDTAQLANTRANYRNLGQMAYDQWVDYVIHVRFDPDGTNGILQLWRDGVPILDEHKISVGYRASKPIWRFGLTSYTGKSSHLERRIYYDQVRLGNRNACYDAVAPGNSQDVYKPMKP